jgi:hypothetical protein
LGCADAEAHVASQNDRQEVGQCVGNRRCVEKDLYLSVSWHSNRCPDAYQCETPDFNVGTALEELGKRPWLRLSITTIPVDTVDDVHGFTLGQEVPRFMRLVGEIDQSPVTDDTEKAC